MGKFLLGGAAALFPLQTPEYYTLSGRLRGNTVESNRQQKMPVAGTLSNFAVYVDGGGTGRTVKTRINTADGTLAPTITDSVAGIYRDSTHSDPIAVNDLVAAKQDWPNNTTTFYWMAMTWEATSGHVGIYTNDAVISPNPGTTLYVPIEGDGSSSTEADSEELVRVAGTRTNTAVNLNANTLNVAITVVSRLNGANGGMSFVISSGAGTGLFTDGGSGSDTLAAGDKICTKISVPAGTGSSGTNFVMGLITAASGTASDNFSFGRIARAASATTHYYPPLSAFSVTTATSETERRIQPGFACTLRNFRVRLSANTYGSALTVVLRKNGVDQVTLSVPNGSTAVIEDTSSVVNLNSTDDISWSAVGGTSGSGTIAYFAFTLETQTGTAAISDPNDTVSSVGSLVITGTAAITDPNDTVSSAGSISGTNITGAAAISDPNDTVAGVGSLVIAGAAAITDPNDTVAGVGSLVIAGAAAITDANDTLASVGSLVIAGAAAITDPNDTVSSAANIGGSSVLATAAITDPNDTVAGVGSLVIAGAAAMTDPNDTVSSAGSLVIIAATAANDPEDTLLSVAGVTIVGSASISDPNDTVQAIAPFSGRVPDPQRSLSSKGRRLSFTAV